MKLMKSILFWTAAVLILFLAARGILALNGLQFRVWFRETVTMLIPIGAAAGLLQLLLRIQKKAWKIVSIVLWAAACIGFTIFGFIQFAFLHRYDGEVIEYNGKTCIEEYEHVMWVTHTRYYEYHNFLICGKEYLYSDAPYENIGSQS